MPDTIEWMMTPEDFEAYSEAVRWIVWGPFRRAGTLGRIVALKGTDASGSPIQLVRVDDQTWRLVDGKGNTVRDISASDVVKEAGDGSLVLTHARTRHELPPLLFQSAVASAEASLHELQKAENPPPSPKDDDSDPESRAAFDFIMVTHFQDGAIRPAVVAVILVVATAEAQVNAWAQEFGGWQVKGKDNEGRYGLVRKCEALAAKAGKTLDTQASPFRDLRSVVKRRNDFVHSSPAEEVVAMIGPDSIPGRALSLEARESCLIVRQSLVDLARVIGVEPPRYLAYCPPGRPDDEEEWGKASIWTGMRDDRDFPTAVEQAEESKRKRDASS
jgi:hypothetical protein